MSALIVSRREWPHGLRCMDCDERIALGYAYSKRLIGVAGDCPVVEIVCVPCALGLSR